MSKSKRARSSKARSAPKIRSKAGTRKSAAPYHGWRKETYGRWPRGRVLTLSDIRDVQIDDACSALQTRVLRRFCRVAMCAASTASATDYPSAGRFRVAELGSNPFTGYSKPTASQAGAKRARLS